MKRNSLLSLTLLTLCSACGGGGGSSSVFDFEGLWLSSFVTTTDSCGLAENDTGTLALTISQTTDVVLASNNQVVWQGSADSDSFTAVFADMSLFTCPDGTALDTTTSTLRFESTNDEKANFVELSFFGDCPTFSEQCELTYRGSAIRLPRNTAGAQAGENTLY